MFCTLINSNCSGCLIILGAELHRLSRKLLSVSMPVSCLTKCSNENLELEEESFDSDLHDLSEISFWSASFCIISRWPNI